MSIKEINTTNEKKGAISFLRRKNKEKRIKNKMAELARTNPHRKGD